MSFYEELRQRLVVSGMEYRLHQHAPSITVAQAETYLDFPIQQLLKTIAFRVKNNGWVLAALCGHPQVDYKKLAVACKVSRDKLMRLTPGEVERDLGFEVGSVSPLATNLHTLIVIDVGALEHEWIFCGTGRKDRTLEIRPADLVMLSGATVVPLAKE